ncbi:E3 ubiquitin-protein ligase SH3RF2-like isoform X1 [Polypterus senegalus]|uniref:E3 ubiquitin-protein ligase SH3RF2-like isoform X1 n=1 Tax=Polypterus senegalus TaxID=55291 RepID=UPI001965B616|nr:E3 ubiquitin-protein ligase SH3RF2-like isoform X1 [Polypterus senegalus]XP_039632365.1 E3 ubiquitin-protein ligase SH3RF2-like isoform X1 [Polypterus senegalus]
MEDLAFSGLLDCPVCFERLNVTARVLPCQHTFCNPCLLRLACPGTEFRCPECRTPIGCGIEELPANLLLVRLLESIKKVSNGASSSGQVSQDSPDKNSSKNPESQVKMLSEVRRSLGGVPCARALFDYGGNDPRHLKFKPGDIILLKRQVDDNWFHGEVNGASGLIPASYVQIITKLPQPPPLCRALYTFEMKEKEDVDKHCLMFAKDDIITVIRRVDENWAEGKLGNKVGIFPLLFTEPNSTAAKLLGKGKARSLPESRSALRKSSRSGLFNGGKKSLRQPSMTSTLNRLNRLAQPPGNERQAVDISSPVLISSSNPAVTTQFGDWTGEGPPAASCQVSRASVGKTQSLDFSSSCSPPAMAHHSLSCPVENIPLKKQVSVSVCTVLYPYVPQRPEELELQKGEMIGIYGKHQEGWLRGLSLRTGKGGILPGNYVTPVLRRSPSVVEPLPATPQLGKRSLSVRPQTPMTTLDRTHTEGTTRPAVHPLSVSMSAPLTTTGVARVMTQQSGTLGRVPVRHGFTTLQKGSSVYANTTLRPATSAMMRAQLSDPTLTVPRPLNAASAPVTTLVWQNYPGNLTKTGQRIPGRISPPSGNIMPVEKREPAGSEPIAKSPVTPQSILVKPDATKNYLEKPVKTVRFQTHSTPHVKRNNSEPLPHSHQKPWLEETNTGIGVQEVHGYPGSVVCHSRARSFPVATDSKMARHKKTNSLDLSASDEQLQIPQNFSTKKLFTGLLVPGRYKAVAPHGAQSEMELDLKEGDVLLVKKSWQDGWLQGTNEQTGKSGLFPYSCLTCLEMQS